MQRMIQFPPYQVGNKINGMFSFRNPVKLEVYRYKNQLKMSIANDIICCKLSLNALVLVILQNI